MATRPKAIIESRNGEKFSPITIAKNVLTDDGQNLHDILSDRKEDMMTPTIENSSSMFKVGQGDDVDYSENVVDGAYESCVLKGKSLVNDIGSFLKNAGSGVANVIQNNNDIEIEITTSGSQIVVYNLARGLKPNTKYLFKGIKEFTGANLMFGFDDGHYTLLTYEKINESYIVETGSSTSCLKFYIGYTGIMNVGDRLKIMNPLLLEYQEGLENLDLPYFEGLCDVKSPILSNVGKNLWDIYKLNDAVCTNKTNNSFVLKSWASTVLTNQQIREILKPNTKYTMRAKFRLLKGSNLPSYSQAIQFLLYAPNEASTNVSFFLAGSTHTIGEEYEVTNTFTTPSDFTTKNLLGYSKRYANDSHVELGEVEFTDVQLEEAPLTNAYEPYKSNILSANGDKIELTEDMFEQGGVYFTKGQSFADATNNTAPDRIRLKTLLNLKPNTTYRVAIDNAYKVGVQLYNNEKLAVSDSGWVTDTTFTTKGGEKFVALVIRKLSSAANISMSDFKNIKLQLSEVDKTIVLRSLPNRVCDTLNVETGEYVQRIGEVVLDGSEDENWMGFATKPANMDSQPYNLCQAYVLLNNCKYPNPYAISDKLPNIDVYFNEAQYESIRLPDSMGLYIRLKQSSLNGDLSLNGFKTYLSQNPVTVQYELATPIVSTVDIQGFPFSYKNGHVQLSSGSIEQSLTPKVEYSVVTNRNGQIRSNQKMVERHQKQLDRLQAMILTNLVNTQYEQTLTNLKYDLKNVREEVK